MIKKTILTSCLVICSLVMYANNISDSLSVLLQKETVDTSKVKLLIQLGESNVSDSSHVLSYANQALALSQKNEYANGIAKATLLIGRSFMRYKEYDKARQYFLNSIPFYKESNDAYGLTRALNNVGLSHFKISQADSAITYLYQSIELAKKHNYDDRLGFAYATLGLSYSFKQMSDSVVFAYEKASEAYHNSGKKSYAYGYLNNISIYFYNRKEFDKAILAYEKAKLYCINQQMYDKAFNCILNMEAIARIKRQESDAIKYIDEAIRLAEEHDFRRKAENLYIRKIVLLRNQGLYDVAIEYAQKALNIFEKDSTAQDQRISIISEIATTHREIENKEFALENYNKALALSQKHQLIDQELRILIGIALVYLDSKDYDRYIELNEKIIKISRREGKESSLATSLNNLGHAYIVTGDAEQAKAYLFEALKIAEENDLSLQGTINASLAEMYMLLGQNAKALKYGEQSLKMQSQNNDLERLVDIHKIMSDLHYKMGSYKSAYEHLDSYKQLSDSLFSARNLKKTTTLEMQYAFDKEQERKAHEQQEKDAQKQMELERHKMMRNSFIIGFILMSLLAIVVLRSFIQKRKSNRLLASQKTEIEAQAAKLNESNQRLIQLDAFKENMTSMIVHDLKAPLNAMLNVMSSFSLEEQVNRMKNSGKQMLNMVLNILDVYKSEKTAMVVSPKEHALYNVCQQGLSTIEFLAQQKNIEITNSLSVQLGVWVDIDVIERVFTNIVSNAIKYSGNNSQIVISSEALEETENGSFIKVLIKDNGQGIPKDQLKKVFDTYQQVDAKASGGVRSTGIGLTFCKIAIEAHKGQIGIDSEYGEGTTVWFTIPASEKLYDIDDAEKASTPKAVLEMSDAGHKELNAFYKELCKFEVYEVTYIYNVLAKVNNVDSAVDWWIKELKTAMASCNEEKYHDLLRMIK